MSFRSVNRQCTEGRSRRIPRSVRKTALLDNNEVEPQSALFLGYRSREIGGLVRHPIDEFADCRVGQQALYVRPKPLQFGIGKIGDQRLLTNRMHGNHVSPASAFGHGVVPYNGLPGRTSAEPAVDHAFRNIFLLVQVAIGITSGMLRAIGLSEFSLSAS